MKEFLTEIDLQIVWNRLISIAEEQAQTLIRTAFGSAAREAGDVSAGIFDCAGRMIAQAVTGTPGHVNTMARAVGHFLKAFPLDQLNAGDVLITNDPWKGTGHLFDFTVVTPAFREERVIGLFACTTHVVDIGGAGTGLIASQIYHEGLQVPIMHLARAGVMNKDLLSIISQNVREPFQVLGDIYALAACNDVGIARLTQMMDEFELANLSHVADVILDRSRNAMEEAINKLPRGRWSASMTFDGYDAPIELMAALENADGRIHVDFSGSSEVSTYPINCPRCYTEAYTSFAVKCIVAPTIPNNAGTLECVSVTAPESSIVNAQAPVAVAGRGLIGHMIPDVIFGCFAQALPETVPAEGTSCLWSISLSAGHGLTGKGSNVTHPFNIASFHSGGTGGRPLQDGLSATPFPSGVRNVPVEISESISPVLFWRKELRSDSGGPGRQRGGLGQIIEIGSRIKQPFGINHRFDRVRFPPRGRAGGHPGEAGRVRLKSGGELTEKGYYVIPDGDRIVLEMPGGGGYGDPMTRDPHCVYRDFRAELVSAERARHVYGVVISPEGALDMDATSALRSQVATGRL